MKHEIEKELSEFFLIQKNSDGRHLPAFAQVVGKASAPLIQWKQRLLVKVAAMLVVITVPIYFIMKPKTAGRQTTELIQGEQFLWPIKLQSDYLPVRTTYLWNWKAPTDALLPAKNFNADSPIRDKGNKK